MGGELGQRGRETRRIDRSLGPALERATFRAGRQKVESPARRLGPPTSTCHALCAEQSPKGNDEPFPQLMFCLHQRCPTRPQAGLLPCTIGYSMTRAITGREANLPMNQVHPKKLLLTKWTAAQPVSKEKHFLVLNVVLPEPPDTMVEFVDLEAVHSKSVRRIAWRDLRDQALWRQGWV